ncbi:TolC family protein [Syntrophomonas wolfei]|jgi:outer membrane protein TolC|uniref:TolC family protein n=1 Tax=Syntrophomonas wolfei TaxID=863 RepID=UPI0007731F88|nr:TolC family protein [Syntrophomonas wolfei]
MNKLASKQRKKWLRNLMALALVLALAIGITASPAVAEQTSTPAAEPTAGLSLNAAIAQALKHSEALSKASKEMDRTKEIRDYAGSQLDYIPVGHIGIPAVEMAYTNVLASDLTWQLSQRSFTVAEDKVILDTCKKYWEVLKAVEKLKTAESSQAAALRQLQNARMAQQVGMSLIPNQSPTQLVLAAEAQYAGAQAAVAAAQNGRDNAYNSFNQHIGLWITERPQLSDSIKFEPLEVSDLEHEVSRVLERSPVIWQADEMVNMKNFLKDITIYSSGQYRPGEARRIEVEQAELDAASAKKLVAMATRTLYYQTRNLEEAYAGSLEAIKMAEENLRVKRLMLEVGMATEAEVKAEEKKLDSARYTALEMAATHSYMKLAFSKPWAADLSSAGSSPASSAAEE